MLLYVRDILSFLFVSKDIHCTLYSVQCTVYIVQVYLGKWLKLLYEVCRVRDILSFLFVSKDEINPLVEMSRHVFTL